MPTSLTVSPAAREARLTPKAVRLYEARGLLPPVARDTAGYRRYTDEDVQRLRFIGHARAAGLGLGAIRRIIELRQGGEPPGPEVLAVLDAHLHRIEQSIADLEDLRDTLAAVIEQTQDAVHHDGNDHLCRILADRELT
jgi:MerR family copper efflux transcriptional regulator